MKSKTVIQKYMEELYDKIAKKEAYRGVSNKIGNSNQMLNELETLCWVTDQDFDAWLVNIRMAVTMLKEEGNSNDTNN